MLTAAGISFLAGMVFGLALAAPPGPMNAIIAEESVVRGWSAGFKAGLGAMLADVVFFLLALAGAVTVVERFPRLRSAMVIVGGGLMLYFALDAVRSAKTALSGTDVPDVSRGFRKTFVLALTNPYQILFWLTVGVGLLDPGRIDMLGKTPYVGDSLAGLVVVETGSIALLAGLFGGIVVWILGFPATLVAADERVDRFAPLVAGASAFVLVGFGVFFLWDGATAFV
jgi:threonine/homoserine/homoserine lactone efflux protein